MSSQGQLPRQGEHQLRLRRALLDGDLRTVQGLLKPAAQATNTGGGWSVLSCGSWRQWLSRPPRTTANKKAVARLDWLYDDDLGASALSYLATGTLLGLSRGPYPSQATPRARALEVGSLVRRLAVLRWLLDPAQADLWPGLNLDKINHKSQTVLHCCLLNGGSLDILTELLSWWMNQQQQQLEQQLRQLEQQRQLEQLDQQQEQQQQEHPSQQPQQQEQDPPGPKVQPTGAEVSSSVSPAVAPATSGNSTTTAAGASPGAPLTTSLPAAGASSGGADGADGRGRSAGSATTMPPATGASSGSTGGADGRRTSTGSTSAVTPTAGSLSGQGAADAAGRHSSVTVSGPAGRQASVTASHPSDTSRLAGVSAAAAATPGAGAAAAGAGPAGVAGATTATPLQPSTQQPQQQQQQQQAPQPAQGGPGAPQPAQGGPGASQPAQGGPGAPQPLFEFKALPVTSAGVTWTVPRLSAVIGVKDHIDRCVLAYALIQGEWQAAQLLVAAGALDVGGDPLDAMQRQMRSHFQAPRPDVTSAGSLTDMVWSLMPNKPTGLLAAARQLPAALVTLTSLVKSFTGNAAQQAKLAAAEKDVMQAPGGSSDISAQVNVMDTSELVQALQLAAQQVCASLGVDEATALSLLSSHNYDLDEVLQHHTSPAAHLQLAADSQPQLLPAADAAQLQLEVAAAAAGSSGGGAAGLGLAGAAGGGSVLQAVAAEPAGAASSSVQGSSGGGGIVAGPVQARCTVCWEDEGGAAFTVALACGHNTCDACWQGVLLAQLDGGTPWRACCPAPGCGLPLPQRPALRLLPPASHAKYQSLLSSHYVSQHPRAAWCPRPGCGHSVQLGGAAGADGASTSSGTSGRLPWDVQAALLSGRGLAVRCACGQRFCFRCGGPPHEPATCGDVESFSDSVRRWHAAGAAATAAYLSTRTRKCVKCKVATERVEGCNHMVCSQCRAHWCWACGQDWALHGKHTGGFYSCDLAGRTPGAAAGGSSTSQQADGGEEAMERQVARFAAHHTLCRRTSHLLGRLAWCSQQLHAAADLAGPLAAGTLSSSSSSSTGAPPGAAGQQPVGGGSGTGPGAGRTNSVAGTGVAGATARSAGAMGPLAVGAAGRGGAGAGLMRTGSGSGRAAGGAGAGPLAVGAGVGRPATPATSSAALARPSGTTSTASTTSCMAPPATSAANSTTSGSPPAASATASATTANTTTLTAAATASTTSTATATALTTIASGGGGRAAAGAWAAAGTAEFRQSLERWLRVVCAASEVQTWGHLRLAAVKPASPAWVYLHRKLAQHQATLTALLRPLDQLPGAPRVEEHAREHTRLAQAAASTASSTTQPLAPLLSRTLVSFTTLSPTLARLLSGSAIQAMAPGQGSGGSAEGQAVQEEMPWMGQGALDQLVVLQPPVATGDDLLPQMAFVLALAEHMGHMGHVGELERLMAEVEAQSHVVTKVSRLGHVDRLVEDGKQAGAERAGAGAQGRGASGGGAVSGVVDLVRGVKVAASTVYAVASIGAQLLSWARPQRT